MVSSVVDSVVHAGSVCLLTEYLIQWSIQWLPEWLIECLTELLTEYLIQWLNEWSAEWLIERSTEWLIQYATELFIEWFTAIEVSVSSARGLTNAMPGLRKVCAKSICSIVTVLVIGRAPS